MKSVGSRSALQEKLKKNKWNKNDIILKLLIGVKISLFKIIIATLYWIMDARIIKCILPSESSQY